MKESSSKRNLLDGSVEDVSSDAGDLGTGDFAEKPLGPIEKRFLLYAERGDCATVRTLIETHGGNVDELDINCVDPLNRSALVMAIENENIDLIKLLLEFNIEVKDALLHAIKEEYVEAVEVLLNWEEHNHKPGESYSWESVPRASSSFTSDITPLILAAHKNNYEILKILLDRGATLPIPHDVRCGCDECEASNTNDSLRHSQARINAYRALTASSLIALSSPDPILTAFELSWELRRLSRMETEFRSQYNEMRNNVQEFAAALLDHTRTSNELEVMLNYNPVDSTWQPGERQTLDRLKLSIKYKQKIFVAHPNVQQLLAAIWYEGLPGFRRKTFVGQILQVVQMGVMFPVYCTLYMVAPNSEMGLFMKKPFVKFICQSSSYLFFLGLLGCASQRIEFLLLEWFGTESMREMVQEWKRKERGATPGLAECGVALYVISLVWGEMRSLWSDGIMEYVSDLWNVVDFITNMFYIIWIAMRVSSWLVVTREYSQGYDPWYPREQWHAFEPMLLSEGAFAAAMIFSFLKLVHIFSVNPHLGPLQISLSRMIIDIVKFFFIYTLVLFAFGCGLNQLLFYYAELEKNKCYVLPNDVPDFENHDKACSIWRRYANLFETSQSLFWASFGLVDLVSFELTGIKGFTRFWALLMFGSYSVINVIVLLNMLIAMMSNSYQIISERADTEWKFARTKLWISYFDDDDDLPPPFNLFPSTKAFQCKKGEKRAESLRQMTRDKVQERHKTIMRLLIRRYVTAEQRSRDDYGITEDDVMEIRQDISSLRYELVDILHQNGMKTPKLSQQDMQLAGKKGKTMERRILKDFRIGSRNYSLEQLASATEGTKDFFGQLAKAMGKSRKGSSKRKKQDWNTLVRKNTVAQNPIGSAQEAEQIELQRENMRKYILESAKKEMQLDTDKLMEYNPKLAEVPKRARIAYAKFMTKRFQQNNIEEIKEEEEKPDQGSGTQMEDTNQLSTAETNVNTVSKSVDVQAENDGAINAADDSLKHEAESPPEPIIATVEVQAAQNVEDAANVEAEPTIEDAPKEEAANIEEMPTIEEIPKVEETPKVQEIPKVEEPPKAEAQKAEVVPKKVQKYRQPKEGWI